MTSELAPFTRELEDCRKRWNQGSLKFVLGMANILSRARRAAKEERHWTQWVKEETHMNPATVYRYLRVQRFFHANISLKHEIDCLSIAKIYALSRLQPSQAVRLIREGKAARMSDMALVKQIRLLTPARRGRPTTSNLVKSISAAMNRLERVMYRWQSSRRPMPPQTKAKLVTKLKALAHAVGQLEQTQPMAI